MPAPRGLIQWVDQSLHQSGLLPRGARLLVAVSGGADSVALLRLLVAINGSDYWGWTLVVGHVEHGIRGEESVADARWVAELAETIGLAHTERTLGLGPNAPEAVARNGRFKALKAMAAEHACVGIVMAHHADDQAETMLMRLFRGCGIDGLRAMVSESRRDASYGGFTIWRPLLHVRRKDLREYLVDIGQTWREDRTNTSEEFARNRLRAQVMPVVEELWPGAVEALGRLSQIASESYRVVEGAAEELRKKANISWKDSVLPRKPLQEALPGLVAQLLREQAVANFGTDLNDFERISEAVRLIQGTHGAKEIELGSGLVVEIRGEQVHLTFRRPVRRDV